MNERAPGPNDSNRDATMQKTEDFITLSLNQVDQIWPFHIFIKNGLAYHIGKGLSKCLGGRELIRQPMETFVNIVLPEPLPGSIWHSPQELEAQTLEIILCNEHAFCGELHIVGSSDCLLIMQPLAHSVHDLDYYNLQETDLSKSDPLRHHRLHADMHLGLKELLLQEAKQNYTDTTHKLRENWLDMQLDS